MLYVQAGQTPLTPELLDLRDRAVDLLKWVKYKEGWELILSHENTAVFIQVRVYRSDVHTGEMGYGFGGKAYLRSDMSDRDIVARAFHLIWAFEEHECREFFKWREGAIFGPHITLDALRYAASYTDPVRE